MDHNFSTARDSRQILPERDSSKRVLTGCFLSLLIFTTLLGNTLVCVAVTKFRHLRSKVTNFFVISLAISDLLVAILVMPWKAATEIVGFWPFGAFCNIWVAFDIMCSTASILNLCVISVDRYWAISSPFRYERKMTPRVACLMISVAWTLSVLISFIPVQLNWHKAQTTSYTELNRTYSGELPPDNCDSSLNRSYAISSSLISFYIPVAIMIVTYTRIYRIAQKQIRRISALERAAESAKHRHSSMGNTSSIESESSFKMSFKRETKVLKTLSVIMGVFVCCWLPFFILNCMVPFCESNLPNDANDFHCISPTTFDVFVWFGWANSSLNPIIYAFNADFRKAFSILLGCHRLCPGSNAIEILSINNNAGAPLPNPSCQYQPKSLIPKEANHSDGCVMPHSILCQEEELHKLDGGMMDEMEVGVVNNALDKLCPAISGNLDSDTEISLEKINPITQNGQHNTMSC
ncbi:dopamine receptor D1b [Syngnathoides biaculeatus]|uniref:dopamine receptor D1b n=1 Tax=Syngnathoides biaculeatus TaxID=300417 RepID=UPI002ADD9767|nr:dopamine receptor D1b [Syngnathoides biaculeatus]XP_061659103.1 dopamine receptor D1b [Syngnathoides biaculeatus]XP_061659104.1 dopamine receptor D1b [Syngnathoides biaculeatus]XP_061659105.1 dopamine receptor D1b [Syngnathoides biaculeatus]